MAASIYATPPPDLSSEDTALSDVSNSSSSLNNRSVSNTKTNSRNNNTADEANATTATAATATTTTTSAKKRSIAEVLMDNHSGQQQQSPHNADTTVDSATATAIAAAAAAAAVAGDCAAAQNASAAMAAVAAAANAAMQMQLFEAIDAAKKRRKQNNPSRLGALNLSGAEDPSGQEGEPTAATSEDGDHNKQQHSPTIPIDYEEKLSKMFLPKSMEQLRELKQTFELLQQQQLGNISPTNQQATKDFNEMGQQCESDFGDDALKNPYQTFCKECGENFETEFKLSLHMLQEHNGAHESEEGNGDSGAHKNALSPFDILASVKVKLERPDYDSPTSPQAASGEGASGSGGAHSDNAHLLSNGKEQWMNAMPAMGFPFPPEAAAAAALSATGYLPLLGVPGFPGVDGLNRPPLRIFNPEAYCDLCNKEFCNKYFLKTHKANKHGIYDPAAPAAGDASSATSNLNTMNQMFQLQMQQQHQQLQQQKQHQQNLEQQALAEAPSKHAAAPQGPATLNIPQQVTPPAPPPVYCDICSKRFTNVFAMRRHRAKAHEQPAQAQRNSPNEHHAPAAAKQEAKVPSPDAKAEAHKTQEATAKQFQMPEGFSQDFTLEQEEVSFTPQPRKLSPQSQQQAREANFAHDKLKRLGVLNPEAFCELCCKEYCNKYFLRTHKWKRHGIFVPPDDFKDEQLQLAQKMPWPFMNMPGMSLNLMMANEKAVVAQRMLAAAAAANNAAEHTAHMSKRIKLELQDDDMPKTNDENQENKSELNRDAATQQQRMSATPEPPKILGESFSSSTNLPTSPEAAVGLQNLQKLQSMIQQLSDLNGKRPVSCHICGHELEHQYALHAHMMTEHAGGMEGSNSLPLNFQQHILQQQQQQQQQQQHQQQQQQALKLSPSSSSPGAMSNVDLRCNHCDRDFPNLPEFKQHIAEVRLLPSSPLREGFVTPERPINPNSASGTRPPYTITPTSSYCEICNKELCNKYFMKTHMQRMHGIEIENGAQIGGVVCNICNKELCSKYFLRVHKHNTHGIIEEGAPLPQPRQNGLNFEAQQQQQQIMETELGRGLNLSPFGASITPEVKTEAADARFYANYAEVCTICTRRFRSPKWLRAHLMGDHGAAGIEKLRELEQQYGTLSKPASPTLKIPNGASATSNSSNSAAVGLVPSPANLAQALQNLNAQHLLGNMPKNVLPGMFGAVAEQALQSPHFKDYQCSMCPFTTPYYAFLFIHERSHTILNNATGDKVSNNGAAADAVKLEPDQPVHHQLPQHATNDSNEQPNASMDEPTNLSTRSPTPTKHGEANSPNAKPTSNSKQAAAKQQVRSAATSPIAASSGALLQDILNEIANKCGKPACYALPKNACGSTTGEQQQMQAFVVEARQNAANNDNGETDADADDTDNATAHANDSSSDNCNDNNNGNRFVPAIIYLPVRERVTGPITVSFNLTPA